VTAIVRIPFEGETARERAVTAGVMVLVRREIAGRPPRRLFPPEQAHFTRA